MDCRANGVYGSVMRSISDMVTLRLGCGRVSWLVLVGADRVSPVSSGGTGLVVASRRNAVPQEADGLHPDLQVGESATWCCSSGSSFKWMAAAWCRIRFSITGNRTTRRWSATGRRQVSAPVVEAAAAPAPDAKPAEPVVRQVAVVLRARFRLLDRFPRAESRRSLRPGADSDAQWPQSGLPLLWREPIGGGYASFAIAGGRAFTIEQRRHKEAATAYDLATGRRSNGRTPGMRSSRNRSAAMVRAPPRRGTKAASTRWERPANYAAPRRGDGKARLVAQHSYRKPRREPAVGRGRSSADEWMAP